MLRRLVLLIVLFAPSYAIAGPAQEIGERICRLEAGENLTARQQCLVDWQYKVFLVIRYMQHAELMSETYEAMPMGRFFAFENPFILSPHRVYTKCSGRQFWNGNILSGLFDFRQVWDCIAEIDPEAAAWETI